MILTSLLALVSTATLAAAPTPFYVGADLGSMSANGYDDRETGYGLFAGYQIMDALAVE